MSRDGNWSPTADDDNADEDALDHAPRFELADGAKAEPAQALDDMQREGEIEGPSFDEDSGEMLVPHNRGTRIEQGMSVGLCDG